MSDFSAYTWPSPLEGWDSPDLPPLTDERNPDGRTYKSPITKPSESYQKFTSPIRNGTQVGSPGFDVHIYYMEKDEEQKKFARELWLRIRREFPELALYEFWEKPIGPHPTAMFEVNIFTPAQFGAFIPWLVINRGPLSALIHPNTIDPETGEITNQHRDHGQRATWMGDRFPLNLAILKKFDERRKQKVLEERAAAAQNGESKA